TITRASLTAATAAIGATQGELRATHLKYHLAMMDVLTPEQIRRSGELRGYAAAPAGHSPSMHNHKKGGAAVIMKDDVKRSGMDETVLRDIAAEADAAFNSGGRQVQPFSGRFPDLTMDDAYRVTALANGMRVARGYRPVGRKIGFTNRRIWDEYGVHAPVWGYIYDRTLRDLA